MDALGHQRFALVGHDTGMVIAYALAADHPERVDRLVVAETTLPGVAPSPPLFVPAPINDVLWHISFNRVQTLNEQLVSGREDLFFSFEFNTRTGPAGMTFAVVARGFQANEQVVTWLNTPTSVQELQLSGRASAGGNILLQFDSAGLAPNYYGLVLHGLDSKREYLLPFSLTG
jgi:pimeloyl-ACP methyl ester carboxylesterase